MCNGSYWSESGHEACTSTSNLQQTAKRVHADMLTAAGGIKNEEEIMSGNTV